MKVALVGEAGRAENKRPLIPFDKRQRNVFCEDELYDGTPVKHSFYESQRRMTIQMVGQLDEAFKVVGHRRVHRLE